MTVAAFHSSLNETVPPAALTPELRSLWLVRNNRWEEAHAIAQDIPTPDGSWIHALLHLIEGDVGNAQYWFSRAGRPARGSKEIDSEWEKLAAHLCKE